MDTVESNERTPSFREWSRSLVDLFSETVDRFNENEGVRLGAAFSYYAMFSLFPLLLLSLATVGFVVGDSSAARAHLLGAIASPGSPAHDVLDRTLRAMQHGQGRGVSAVIGGGTLVFAATGAFVELDAALNRIWKVPNRVSKGFLGSVRTFLVERWSGFVIVLGIGLTLLVSLVSSSLLTFLAARASEEVTIPLWPALVRTADLAMSLALSTAVFTAAFHFIPRSRPPVGPVVRGAFVTTAALTALKELFATYLAKLTSYSAYGVAGGFLALTTWIYASSMVILFGAQLTQTYAERRAKALTA